MKIRRNTLRLPQYDYASEGAYFVTICTESKRKILSELPTVGADDSVRPYALFEPNAGADENISACPTINVGLTAIGRIVEEYILSIPAYNKGVCIDKYVIMPNHIPLLLRLGGQSRPPLQKIVQGFKSITTRQCWRFGVPKLWQRSFYDRVIRNETDYLRVWQYIEENPIRWSEDIFFE